MRAGRSLLLASLVFAASCAIPPERENRPNRAGNASVATSQQAIGWAGGAVAPIRIRSGHTATLLGTSEILLAGGGSAPKTTELVRPYDGVAVPGPDLVEARTGHTATMLLSGKVLLVGGGTSSAELYDPSTRTTTATGSMAVKRDVHCAIRLRSGQVLVAGGTNDLTTELYDPSSGTWSAGPARVGSESVHALATLEDGRILAIGPSLPQTTESFDGTSWTKVVQGVSQSSGVQTLTRLADGRFAVGWASGCVTNGTSTTCSSFTSVVDKGATTTVPGPDFVNGRDFFTAVRTVEGNVLFIGGDPGDTSRRVEELGDPAAVTLANDGDVLATHFGPSATVMTGGDILVAGGTQATLDRRVSPGAWSAAPFLMLHERERHGAVRLHDGKVLVAGGEATVASAGGKTTAQLEAEIIDVAARKTTAAGMMSTAHTFGTLTTLRDGTVLAIGGGTTSVERFIGTGFKDAAPLSIARTGHTATLLPSGKVLVIGGTGAVGASEIFDPTSGAWSAGPTPANAWTNHGAVLLPNGLVLVVGDGAAEIYDETKNAFRPTTAPGASRDGRTAHLLASGKVFVAGGTTLAAEVFDPQSETWSYTTAQTDQFISSERQWTGLPSGKLVASGGHRLIEGLDPVMRVFDPLAHATGSFLEITTAPQVGFYHGVALSGTGEVVSTGGQPAFFLGFGDTMNEVTIYGDNASAILRPTISAVPVTVTAGTKVQITGTGFANGAEAGSGTQASSAVNHPTAVWVSDAGDAVVPSTILDFTDTTATWLVPTTALYGHGQLFVNVAGVFSSGQSVTIAPALAATACANDAQCAAGFCTDGVCCDRRCDGVCEGCSKARKTNGEDGVCGAVPPGKDITGRCVLKLGEACNGGGECGTGFCAQGVCCDSTCDGMCLACNLQGNGGRCSAINEGSCGAACDGDHTLKQIGVDDVSCAPYKCSGPQCNLTCASARDCVAPAVCSYDNHCVPPVTPPSSSDTPCGCRTVGAPTPSYGGLLALFMTAIAMVRRALARGGACPEDIRGEGPDGET